MSTSLPPPIPALAPRPRAASVSRGIVRPERMRSLNRRALLARLHALGRASRADLAKALGMSQPTTGKIVDELLRAGVVEEVTGQEAARAAPASRGRLGRPGRMVQLNAGQPRFLAIELGVAETRAAALPVGGVTDEQWTVSWETTRDSRTWSGRLQRATAGIVPRPLWGVLMSVPGVVDEAGGRVLFSPNLHWTERADLPGLIRGVWGVPVLLVQEERALALGHYSVEPALDDFLLVDIGEGVGGAMMVDGKLHSNPLPISGELGHTPVPGNRRSCGCGAVGCVETLVSERGLLLSFARARRAGPVTWAALGREIAARGVPDWLIETLSAAGSVIAGAINVLGLNQVVVTGCLSELPEVVFQELAAAVRRGAMWARFGEVVVRPAPRRRAAGLVAAGLEHWVTRLAGRSEVDRAAADAVASPVHEVVP